MAVKHVSKSLKIPPLSRSWRLENIGQATSSLESCLSLVQLPPPVIRHPSDILVRVKAASVNPLGKTDNCSIQFCLMFEIFRCDDVQRIWETGPLFIAIPRKLFLRLPQSPGARFLWLGSGGGRRCDGCWCW